jgi:hypothetical protein
MSRPDPQPVEVPIPKFIVEPAVAVPSGEPAPSQVQAAAGQQTSRIILATLNGIPEVKTEWEMKCKTIFGHKICINVPVFYHRTCHVVVYADVHYPANAGANALHDLTQCITGAGMAAAIAAVLSGGSAAASVFTAALKSCLQAKGIAWAQQISVSVGATSQCGGWSPF